METIKVGDRVYWYYNKDIHGTIRKIYLSSHPFYITWDNEELESEWYKGTQILKLPDPIPDK